LDTWPPVEALAGVASVGITAWIAFLARSATVHADTSSAQSNAAATTLAEIESQRRKSELCPHFRVICEPWTPGNVDTLRLRIMLLGPPGLEHVDQLTVRIRDDHFRRGEFRQIMGGLTSHHGTPRSSRRSCPCRRPSRPRSQSAQLRDQKDIGSTSASRNSASSLATFSV